MAHTFTINADGGGPKVTVEADGYMFGNGYFHFNIGGGSRPIETVFSIASSAVTTIRRS